VLLIVDEIQTGMGVPAPVRYEQAGIEPDIMTLAKAGGRAWPRSRRAPRYAVSSPRPGRHLQRNPLMAAVGCAVTQALLAPGFLDGSRAKATICGCA